MKNFGIGALIFVILLLGAVSAYIYSQKKFESTKMSNGRASATTTEAVSDFRTMQIGDRVGEFIVTEISPTFVTFSGDLILRGDLTKEYGGMVDDYLTLSEADAAKLPHGPEHIPRTIPLIGLDNGPLSLSANAGETIRAEVRVVEYAVYIGPPREAWDLARVASVKQIAP